MTCPICLWTSADTKYPFLFETKHWRTVLAPNQSLVGRCVVHLKRHCGDLADLEQNELMEWLEVVRTVQFAVQSAFGARMFNWSCYMNHAFRESIPTPHIHWWAVPRYDHQVEIFGQVFDDPEFGSPYDHSRWLDLPKETHHKIAARIKQAIVR